MEGPAQRGHSPYLALMMFFRVWYTSVPMRMASENDDALEGGWVRARREWWGEGAQPRKKNAAVCCSTQTTSIQDTSGRQCMCPHLHPRASRARP